MKGCKKEIKRTTRNVSTSEKRKISIDLQNSELIGETNLKLKSHPKSCEI